MDAQQFQQMLNAIAAAFPPAPAAGPPPPPVPAPAGINTPYEGGTLDLTSRSGISLFQDGQKALASTFDGKLETLFQFQADITSKADLFMWNAGPHNIFDIPNAAGTNRNLMTEYGSITRAELETARAARDAAAEARPRQNARMMYECLLASLVGNAKNRLIGEEAMHSDGPILLHSILTATYTATFSSAQSTRENLSTFEPRRLKYNIPEVNSAIRLSIQKIRSAGEVNNQEIFHYQFKIYKRIKSPTEWTSYLMHLENTIGTNPNYTPEQLYTDTENQHNKLVNQGLWKPADRSAEEQAIAMLANKGPKPDDKEKTGNKPPFAKSEGKEGDTKQWKGDTFHYCPSKNHKNGHWHKHTPAECNTLKKEQSGAAEAAGAAQDNAAKKDAVTIDKDRVKRAMAGLFPEGNIDTDDLAAAFMGMIQD
jgi:hypothetical protein